MYEVLVLKEGMSVPKAEGKHRKNFPLQKLVLFRTQVIVGMTGATSQHLLMETAIVASYCWF